MPGMMLLGMDNLARGETDMRGTMLKAMFIRTITTGTFGGLDAAKALNSRSYLASNGSDGNDCSRAAPCATLSTAFTNTTAGGEIFCLDTVSTGIIGINHSITID